MHAYVTGWCTDCLMKVKRKRSTGRRMCYNHQVPKKLASKQLFVFINIQWASCAKVFIAWNWLYQIDVRCSRKSALTYSAYVNINRIQLGVKNVSIYNCCIGKVAAGSRLAIRVYFAKSCLTGDLLHLTCHMRNNNIERSRRNRLAQFCTDVTIELMCFRRMLLLEEVETPTQGILTITTIFSFESSQLDYWNFGSCLGI